MDNCQDIIYSNDYEDFIIEYVGQQDVIRERGWETCFQRVDPQFGVIYQDSRNVLDGWRNSVLVVPRIFGLLASDETLDELGVMRVRRQPNLALYGQGVLFGIVDTGAGVRKTVDILIK